MKKTLIFACITLATTGTHAQVTLENNHHLVVGTPMQSSSSGLVQTDNWASITILGTNTYNRGGYMTFGEGTHVAIGEYITSSGTVPYRMRLHGSNGIRYNDADGVVFDYLRTTTTPTFSFYKPVKVQGLSVSSDARLKSDVKSIEGEWESLLELNPVSYKLNSPTPDNGTDTAVYSASSDELASKDCQARVQYGYIAQEMREIFPDLVIEDEQGYLSIDYIGLIPLLVDAVKNLSNEVNELRQANQMQPVRRVSSLGVDEISNSTTSLSQNRPNPFTSSTVIECTVSPDVRTAYIGIYDLQGKQIKHIDVAERGETSVTVECDNLCAGIYIYSLITDGKEIASKRMIITD